MQGSTAPEHRTSEASPAQVRASGGRPKPTSKGQDPRGGCPLRLRGHAGPHERGPSRNHRANSRQKVRRPRHNTQDPVDATSHRRRKQLEEVAKHTLTILAARECPSFVVQAIQPTHPHSVDGFIEVPSLLERAEIGTRRFYEIQNGTAHRTPKWGVPRVASSRAAVLLSVPDASHSIVKRTGPVQFTEGGSLL